MIRSIRFTSRVLLGINLAGLIVVAVVRGHVVLGQVILTVALAVVWVISSVLVRRGITLDRWLWRHSTSAQDDFVMLRSTDEVLDAIADMARRRRRWHVTATHQRGAVDIETGATPLTLVKRIEIRTRPLVDGVQVTVRSSSPQLSDLGENRRVVARIREELQQQLGAV